MNISTIYECCSFVWSGVEKQKQKKERKKERKWERKENREIKVSNRWHDSVLCVGTLKELWEALELWEDSCSCSQGIIVIDYRIHFQTICCQIQALVAPFSLVAPVCVLCIFNFQYISKEATACTDGWRWNKEMILDHSVDGSFV